MAGTYTYEPTEISYYGKDRMRFELGDTMVERKEQTCALCDEEYLVLVSEADSPKKWKRAKLKCIESIFRRFSMEPDTKVGPTTLEFEGRARLWQEEYAQLKAELKKDNVSASAICANFKEDSVTPPYFYAGMMSAEESEGADI